MLTTSSVGRLSFGKTKFFATSSLGLAAMLTVKRSKVCGEKNVLIG